jgi:hypothetical protein
VCSITLSSLDSRALDLGNSALELSIVGCAETVWVSGVGWVCCGTGRFKSLFLGLPLRLFNGERGELVGADATSLVVDLTGVRKGPSDLVVDGSSSGIDVVRPAPDASAGLSMAMSCC